MAHVAINHLANDGDVFICADFAIFIYDSVQECRSGHKAYIETGWYIHKTQRKDMIFIKW